MDENTILILHRQGTSIENLSAMYKSSYRGRGKNDTLSIKQARLHVETVIYSDYMRCLKEHEQ